MASFDPITAIAEVGNTIIKRIWPDPADQAKAMLDMAKLAQEGDVQKLNAHVNLLLGQLEVNKIEAGSTSKFKSWWRPFVGWVCGFSLAYAAILEPFMRFIATTIFKYTGAYPVIDTDLTLQVLLGMLGLAVMRTGEKYGGVQRDSIGAEGSAAATMKDRLKAVATKFRN